MAHLERFSRLFAENYFADRHFVDTHSIKREESINWILSKWQSHSLVDKTLCQTRVGQTSVGQTSVGQIVFGQNSRNHREYLQNKDKEGKLSKARAENMSIHKTSYDHLTIKFKKSFLTAVKLRPCDEICCFKIDLKKSVTSIENTCIIFCGAMTFGTTTVSWTTLRINDTA